MKKNIVTAIITLFLLTNATTAQNTQSTGEGFLAVSGSAEWEYYDQQTAPNDLFLIPITLSGVSSNYEIVSNLQVAPEVFHLKQYYDNDSSDLAAGEVLPFSYANYELLYKVGTWGPVSLNLGLKIGHYGYMSSDWTTPAYAIFASPTAMGYATLTNNFMVKIPVEMPVGIYLNNIDEYFTLKTGVEVVFDPAGQISNPVTNSTLLSVGMNYTYLNMKTSDSHTREINYIKPFIKITILY